MKASKLVHLALAGSIVAFCCSSGQAIADPGAYPRSVTQLTEPAVKANQPTEAVGNIQEVIEDTLILSFALGAAKVLKG